MTRYGLFVLKVLLNPNQPTFQVRHYTGVLIASIQVRWSLTALASEVTTAWHHRSSIIILLFECPRHLRYRGQGNEKLV